MNEPTGSPISLLFMIGTIFLILYLLAIHPWRRRKKKKVSLLGQLRFTYIIIFIFAGTNIIGGLNYVLFKKELIGLYSIVFGAGLVVDGIFVMKKSMIGLISIMGAFVLNILVWVLIKANLFDMPVVGMTTFPVVYISPLIRGIYAIRDLKQEEKEGREAGKET